MFLFDILLIRTKYILGILYFSSNNIFFYIYLLFEKYFLDQLYNEYSNAC